MRYKILIRGNVTHMPDSIELIGYTLREGIIVMITRFGQGSDIMVRREGAVEKEIFMRARAGNINISFPTEDDAQDWESRLVSKLKESGYRVKEE